MTFSYGYHFCKNNKLNCTRVTLSGRKATRAAALRELRATAKDIERMIKEYKG